MFSSKKGDFGELNKLAGAIAVVAIIIVFAFLFLAKTKTEINSALTSEANNSLAYNATADLGVQTLNFVPWVSIFVLIGIAIVVLAMVRKIGQ